MMGISILKTIILASTLLVTLAGLSTLHNTLPILEEKTHQHNVKESKRATIYMYMYHWRSSLSTRNYGYNHARDTRKIKGSCTYDNTSIGRECPSKSSAVSLLITQLAIIIRLLS